jgi:hypothetical protein
VKINVKLLKKPNGYEGPLAITVEADLNKNQVAFVKEQIYAKIRLPIKSQRLVFQGKALADDKLLKDFYQPSSSSSSSSSSADNSSWTVTCMPTPGASIEPSSSESGPTGSADEGLSEDFWKGLEEYLAKQLPTDKVQKVLQSFKEGYLRQIKS